MDQFLNALRAEGEQDSLGVFTMEVDKANWKLANFRLTSPHDYLLHVVASAVAGQASRLSIKRYPAHTMVFFDGEPFNREELGLLSQPALNSRSPRRARELAIALSAAAGVGNVRFLSIGSDGRGWKFEVVKREATLSATSGIVGQSLEVTRRLQDEELESLRDRCRFSATEIFENEIDLLGSRDFGKFESVHYGYYLLRGPSKIALQPPSYTSQRYFSWTGEAAPGAPTLVLALTSARSAREHGFFLVSDGVGTRIDADGLGMPLLCGAVGAEHLTKDISQRGYVENSEYEALLAAVRTAARDFLQRFCQNPPPLPTGALAELRHYVGKLVKEGTGESALRAFWDRTAGAISITNSEILEELGRAAANGSPEGYKAAQAELRNELARIRQRGEGPYKARDLLRKEALLHRSAGVVDASFEELQALWFFIYGASKPTPASDASSSLHASLSEDWARATLEDDLSGPVSRYRAKLILLRGTPLETIEAWLDESSPAEVHGPATEWTALIRFALLSAQNRLDRLALYDLGRLRQPLESIALIKQNRNNEALHGLLTLFRASSKTHSPRWLELAAALTRGKVGFSDWVMLRSRLSIASLSDSRWAAWVAYRDWNGLLSERAVKEISGETLVRGAFSPSILPLLLLRVFLATSAHEAWELLGPVLAQQSLGLTKSPLVDLERLPDHGCMWDVLPDGKEMRT